MTDLTTMIFTSIDSGARAIEIDGGTFENAEALTAAHALIAEDPTALAKVMTYFAMGRDVSVIEAPDAFQEAYLAQLDAEPKEAAFVQGVARLRDFGVPSFAEIKAPQIEDGRLIWFCRDGFTGLPYRCETSVADLGIPSFVPMPLEPVRS